MMMRINCNFPRKAYTCLPEESFKVTYCYHPDIGCIVPFIRKLIRHRCVSGKKDLQTNQPMTEVRETDNDPFPNPEKFRDKLLRIHNLLQGLAENNIIKTEVGIIMNLIPEIALQNGQTTSNACGNLIFGKFDTGAMHMLMPAEIIEKITVAAAKVKDSGVRLYPGGNDLQIKAGVVKRGSFSVFMTNPVEKTADQLIPLLIRHQKCIMPPFGINFAKTHITAVFFER